MKTRPIPADRPFPSAALLVLLAAVCVGCGHVLVVQLSGRVGDACDTAQPMACDTSRAHLLRCRPQLPEIEADPGVPGIWEIHCPCVDGCLVEMISESTGFDPVETVTEIDCHCAMQP